MFFLRRQTGLFPTPIQSGIDRRQKVRERSESPNGILLAWYDPHRVATPRLPPTLVMFYSQLHRGFRSGSILQVNNHQ